jgi:NAD(P)-dependent dehydrogenase (short-subunit alcohol dehydrogenase family)
MNSGKGRVSGKVVIITGGGTGLGKAMALALAREGADIVLTARRIGPLEETAKEVTALGCRALAISTDVTDSQQVNRMVEQTLSQMGKLDVLINNAGIVRGQERKPLWEITDQEWRLGIDTNLSGAFYCCRAVSNYFFTQKRGKIVNVASGNGVRGMRGDFMYGSAKAAVINFTRVLAMTWSTDNIQVNCIVPGFVATEAIRPAGSISLKSDFMPVGRIGIPQDIGSLGLFLVSDASDYITGGVFAADGGGLAGGVAPTGFVPIIAMEED